MEQEDKIRTVLSCTLGYSLKDDDPASYAEGQGEAQLREKDLAISPSFGEALMFPLREIIGMTAADHKIELVLPQEKLMLFDLGYKYEDFCRALTRQRNEVLLKDMLMEESVRNRGAEADYSVIDEKGQERGKGRCEPRLYETALVLLPEKGDPLRVPYADIPQISGEDYSLTLVRDNGEKIVLSAMGNRFTGFQKDLSDAMNELSLNAQTLLKTMLPDIPSQTIRKLSSLMKDGQAARRMEIDALSPEIWPSFEKRLEAAGVAEEYEYLKSLSRKERICIGMKRGLRGDLGAEYIWFLMPMYGSGPDAPGNAIAMESVSKEDEGRATYFFRITGRKEYRTVKDPDLDREADNLLKNINQCMIEINFRREPIYLPELKLHDPQYANYFYSVQKLPSLRRLRSLFIGRVIHSSAEQWKRDVMEILKFNGETDDDAAKWK